MAFFPIVEALNLGEVFFLLRDGIDTRYRKVLASSPLTPRASLVVFFWVSGGNLLSRKYLFPTRCVSRSGVGGLIFSTRVLLLFLSGLVPSEISWVYVVGTGGGLDHCLCLRIDGFLHSLLSGVQVPASGIQMGLDGRSQAFPDALNHNLLVQSCSGIKLLEDHLQVFQVGCLVEDFF